MMIQKLLIGYVCCSALFIMHCTQLQPNSTKSSIATSVTDTTLSTGDPAADDVVGNADVSPEMNKGNHQAAEVQPDSFPDCHGRNCELEGAGACRTAGTICDYYRNKCVPKCDGPDCCNGVKCPQGSVCIPGTGRCGKPAGEGCYDLGLGWWTGREVSTDDESIQLSAKKQSFIIQNTGNEPLYFTGALDQPARYDLFAPYCGSVRKMEIRDNHFCPVVCPSKGKVMELDCAPMPNLVTRLRPGQQFTITWNGQEQVPNQRLCEGKISQLCYYDVNTLAGNYEIQVCYSASMDGSEVYQNNPDRFRGKINMENLVCRKFSFTYPADKPVEIFLGQ